MQHFQLVVVPCCTWWQNTPGVAGPTRFGCGSRWAGEPGAICYRTGKKGSTKRCQDVSITRYILVCFSLNCWLRLKSCILLVWPFASGFMLCQSHQGFLCELYGDFIFHHLVFIVCVSIFAAAFHGCLAGGRRRLLVVMSFVARNDAHVLLVAQVCTRHRCISLCSWSHTLKRGSIL
jgi:hypothetical protein